MKLTAFLGKSAIETKVEAEETKLKGYSKFRFFCFKTGKYWFICEWLSGRQVSGGSCTTLAEAKKTAREYLEENTEGDMQKLKDAIEKKGIVN
jgi:hypothetical protein